VLCCRVKGKRDNLKDLRKKYDKTEDDIKALQTTGQMIGEVLKQLDDEKFIVKSSHGPRYVVGCRKKVRAVVWRSCRRRDAAPACSSGMLTASCVTRRLTRVS